MKTLLDIKNHYRWNRSLLISGIISMLFSMFLCVNIAIGAADGNQRVMEAACTLLGLSNSCGTGNTAGISAFWATPKENVASVTFDSQGRVSGMTMVAGKIWYKYQFEEDTAFFNQPVTITKSNISIKQTLSWENGKMDTTKRNELMNLIECGICGLLVIVRDNNGIFWFAGVKYDTETETYEFKPLKPISSDGGQTGANSETDENKFVHILEGKNGEYARQFTLGEAGIPVSYP